MDCWTAAWAVATADERAVWEAVQAIEPDEDRPLARYDAEQAARAGLLRALLRALSKGVLIATGYLQESLNRTAISPALWLDGATVDADEGTGTLANGARVAGLRFRWPLPVAAGPIPAQGAHVAAPDPTGTTHSDRWQDALAIYNEYLHGEGIDPANPDHHPPRQEDVYRDLAPMGLTRSFVRQLQRHVFPEAAARRGPRRAE